MVTIPKLHYISQGASAQEHLNNIQKACTSGAELVQLRLKDLSEKKILKTAVKAREITSHFQTRLIINDYYKIAKEVKADGVHLGKEDACPLEVRKVLTPWQIIGGTANTLIDCENLIKKEVDYIGLGPFRYTLTKENLSPILGIVGYQAILDELKTKTPIIAVGGITLKDVKEILVTGASGIAISGEITRDFSNIKAFHELLNTGSSLEQPYSFKDNKQ